MNRIYRSGSDELATSCGFQGMLGSNINLQDLEPLRKEKQMPNNEWPTMNSSQEPGLNPA